MRYVWQTDSEFDFEQLLAYRHGKFGNDSRTLWQRIRDRARAEALIMKLSRPKPNPETQPC